MNLFLFCLILNPKFSSEWPRSLKTKPKHRKPVQSLRVQQQHTMIRVAAKLSRATSSAVRSARLVPSSHTPCLLCPSPPFRLLHDGTNGPDANPVAIQMINYALSHARSQKSGSSLIHFYLYFKISQTFFIFLFFMVKKKKIYCFCILCILQRNHTDKVFWYWSNAFPLS